MERQKPQKTVIRETKRIAIGEIILVAVMFAVYAFKGNLTLSVVLGGLAGGIYAVFNFFRLGMTVQKVAQMQLENAELARMQMKSSYNIRMVGMLLMVVIAFALPFVDGLACMIPLLFPRITILVLQLTGQIKD